MKTHKLKTCDIIERGMYYVVGQKISVYTTTLPRVIYTFTVISRTRLTDSPLQNYELSSLYEIISKNSKENCEK